MEICWTLLDFGYVQSLPPTYREETSYICDKTASLRNHLASLKCKETLACSVD